MSSGMREEYEIKNKVIKVLVDRMTRLGYLTDNDTSNKLEVVEHYNRAAFLIGVLPRAKRLLYKFFKS